MIKTTTKKQNNKKNKTTTKMHAALSDMMSEDGPVVQAVILRTNGTSEELTINMGPARREVERILGMNGNSFVGQYVEQGVVAVKSYTPPNNTPPNTHTPLPPPLDAEGVVIGDIVLVRINDDAVPEDFTLAEWQQIVDPPATTMTTTTMAEMAPGIEIQTQIVDLPMTSSTLMSKLVTQYMHSHSEGQVPNNTELTTMLDTVKLVLNL